MSIITDTGKFTSKLDLAMATAIASATTPDINAATGNTVVITGTTNITGFSAADQAGIERKLIFNDAVLLTNSASLVLFGAANITTVAGDVAIFTATTTSVWTMTGFFRPTGYTGGQFDSAAILNGSIISAKLGDASVIPSKMPIRERVTLVDGDRTLTAANLVNSGIITMVPTANRNLTTPTATQIIALLTSYQTGTAFEFTVIGLTNDFSLTIVGGTDVTLVGNMSVTQESMTLLATVTSPTTVTIYRK